MPSSPTASRDIERVRRIASVMDRNYLDPIIGFVAPGVGDLLSSVLGLYIVMIGVRQNLPRVTIARMLINLGVDASVGAIPIVGDLFDVGFKAHSRNLELLEKRAASETPSAGDWLYIAAALMALFATVAIPLYICFRLLRWVF